MIRSPLRSPLNPVLSAVVNRRRGGGAAFDPAKLFASGEPGFWYDPSDMSTMFQDSAGSTPVTAVGQPVGLLLDKSKGLVLGPELVTNGDFSDGSTGWTVGTGWTVSGGKAEANTTFNVEMLRQSWAGENNKFYVVQADITMLATPHALARVSINTGGLGEDVITYSIGPLTAGQSFTMYGVVRPTSVSPGSFSVRVSSNLNYAMNYTVDNISVRELPGNHAKQATPTGRPVLQQDGNGKYYLAFDGVDDSMATSTFPIVGLSGDVFIGVRHETGGTIWVDVWLTSQNTAGYWAVGQSGSGFSPTGTTCGSPVYRKNGVDLIAPTRGTIFTTNIDATVVQTTKGVVFGAAAPPSGITISGYAGAYINGRIYSLIVRGALSDAAQIAAAEAYVAGKTGVTL